MTEPITGTGLATAGVAGVTLVSIFGPLDGPTVIGAFAGAAIFVACAVDFQIWWRMFLGALSFAAGLVAAPFTASLLAAVLPQTTAVDLPIGALVASAAAVRILMGISGKDGPSLLSLFRGGR
ncbi:putative holin [Rahnella sp. ChDrAdgB13]|uniref:putative holin n=1 Tax=Rahnella sp. ChDrAdgB13 TaxID=1850581 RepID=UPI001AD89973|nr:putative holin [Rahnella sp. ChDrAdgB13]